MSEASDTRQGGTGKARLIAIGFLGAFFASVITVIYTGLNVEGSSAEFDSGFRSVTLMVGDRHTLEFQFDSAAAFPDAVLEVTLPDSVQSPGQTEPGPARRPVSIVAGENTIPFDIAASSPGSGYVVARVTAGEPVGVYRIFVTVTDDPALTED